MEQDRLSADGSMTRSDRSLHTPGNFARNNLLYVQEVGRLQSLKPHRCVREKLDSFLFLIVLKGSGSLELHGRHYDLQRGDCALIDCMEHYEHISDEADAWQLAWVHFNGVSARGYYDLFRRYNEGSVFTVADVDVWDGMTGNLMEKQENRGFFAELECGELLLGLLNKIVRNVADVSAPEDESERELANDIRKCLNEMYADKNVLIDLAERQDSDPARLNAVFKRFFGINIEEYVNNRRLNAAKEMLRFSIKPVEEVAAEAGLGDAAALQQMFSSSEGMTAEEYRMKWAQWIR